MFMDGKPNIFLIPNYRFNAIPIKIPTWLYPRIGNLQANLKVSDKS